MIHGHEVFHAIFDPPNRSAKAQGKKRNEKIFWIKLSADPETASNIRLDEVNLIFVHPKHGGEHSPTEIRNLGGAPDGQDTATLLVLCEKAAGFQRHRSVPVYPILVSKDMGSVCECSVDIADADSERVCQVPLGKEGARSLLQRTLRVDHCGLRLIVHVDEVTCVLSHVLVRRHNDGDRFADISNTARGKRDLEVGHEDRTGSEPERDGGNMVSNVPIREAFQYSGKRFRAPNINAADQGMRMRTPEQYCTDHVGPGEVGHESAAAGQEP
jgi:hypothetical protein